MYELPKRDGIYEQLASMRPITEVTGVVGEAQVFQLKMWGPIAFPHAKSIEIHLTLPWTEKEGTPEAKYHDDRVVEFRAIGVDRRKDPPKLVNRIRVLDSWVKNLLGDRFVTRIKFNGATIFEIKGNSKSTWATKVQPTEKPASRQRSKPSRSRKKRRTGTS